MDRTLMKVGGAAAMLGAVIAIVFNLLYPRAEEAGSLASVLEAAGTGRWPITHYMLAWSLALVLLGLVAISRSFVREPSASWAWTALVFSIGGLAALYTALVLLGFAVPSAAETTGGEGTEAVALVASGLFLASIAGFFGGPPVLYGIAILSGDEYPAWLGWAAVLAGVVGLLTASVVFFDGFSALTDMVLFPIASLVFTVWIGVMGYLLWQRAPSGG